jgi:hypothetical protein
MPLSSSEAEHTLRDISATGRAAKTFYGYRTAAPHFILWGVIWMLGYGSAYFLPNNNGYIWMGLDAIGIAGSFWLGFRARNSKPGIQGLRYFATAIAVFLFVAAFFSIMPPQTNAQVSAFFPILVALFYSLVGIWTGGLRMLVAGVAIAALTVGGFFWLPQIFALWMAIVGGGALILGGIWFRRA